jgi:Ca2+-binding EF-hand superfamily protein
MVEQIDRDGSGTIEFTEFVEMMKKKMVLDKLHLKKKVRR